MRIHTDIYDDRHGDSRRGPPSRVQGRSKDRPSPERGRRREGPAGAGARGRRQTAAPKQNDAQLTNLSFDERMNYYKEKYAGEGGPAGGEGQRGGNRQGQRPTGSQRSAGSSGPRAPRPARPKHTGQGRAPGQEAAKLQTSPSKSEPAATPKKGLLGRLLGVFKKKPD
jgi:hypothetical protein